MKGKMLTGGLALLCVLLLASTVGAESECGENHVFGPWKTKRETTCRLEELDFRYCRRYFTFGSCYNGKWGKCYLL